MRIAHLSDLHVLALDGAAVHRFLNKRLTGLANLRLRRKAMHETEAVRAAARAIRALDVDHVVITGDLGNLSLEQEFEAVLRLIEEDLGLPAERVSIVPGNHDAYTAGAHRSNRFARAFAPYLRSDLPELASGEGAGAFPYVRLLGPAAIIGLTTAVPRPPFVASGSIGRAQLHALARLLAHPDVRGRTPVILQHHPWHNPASFAKSLLEGLSDAAEEARVLRGVRRGLLLHGHLHRRVHRRLSTDAGHIDAIGATSASLLHANDERMAGFNLYDIAPDGSIGALTSHALPHGAGHAAPFRAVPIPRVDQGVSSR